jgi:transcriptional regulator with XRE-family HTH domain
MYRRGVSKPPISPEREAARRRLGAALASARRFRRVSQEKLGAALGVTRKTIVAWEAGRGEPGASQAEAAARILGVDLVALTSGTPLALAAGPEPAPASQKKEPTP